jgi:hypothetical protein
MSQEILVNRDAEPPEGDFYVTVKDAGRTGFLLGPYPDIREALENVRRGRDLACEHNSRAVFYAYGVSRLPMGTSGVPVVFGEPQWPTRINSPAMQDR